MGGGGRWDSAGGLVARAIARAWFSDVEVEGMDQLPEGPIVVAANHTNGFVDPVLLRAVLPRPARFLAKRSLWKFPLVGRLLGAAGALPVQRAQDGDTAANTSVFGAVHDVLRAGGTVAVFPEGDVFADGRLHRLRTGTARIVLGAREAGVAGVRLVAVGLVYAEQTAPRERALVRIGGSIDVDGFATEWLARTGAPAAEQNREAVAALTDQLTELLRAATIEFADRAEALALADAAVIHQRASGGQVLDDGTVALAAMEPVLRRLAAAPDAERRQVLDAHAAYRLRLALLHMDDTAFAGGGGPSVAAARRGAARALALAVVVSPLSLPGLVVNLPPYLVVDHIATRPMARTSRANFQLLASLVAFPTAWLAWGLGLRRLGVHHPWRWIAVVGPVGGLAALLGGEQSRQVWRNRSGLRALLRNPDQVPELGRLRRQLVEAVDRALAAGAAAAPTPVAS